MKQVPDTGEMQMDEESKTLVREGVPSIISPFDTYALEEGIRIKEAQGGNVTALSMGPEQAQEALKEALAMGVDEAILVTGEEFKGADGQATAYTLAQAIKKIADYDLIITGINTSDGATGQVGPALAEFLNLPHMAGVRKINSLGDGKIEVETIVESGSEIITSDLPAVITVVKEINEPRLPSLKGIMKAKRAVIPHWGAGDLEGDTGKYGQAGSKTKVVKTWTPDRTRQVEMLEGDAGAQAQALVEKLKAEKVI
jgi:electron transfer flavoprotein beta subunit